MNVLPGNFAGLSNGASRSSRFRLIRLVILTAAALFLVWQVATRSLAAYFADARPEMAIRLRSSEPTALLNLTETQLLPVIDPSQQASQTSRLPEIHSTQAVDPSGKSSAASAPEGDASQPGTPDSQVLAESYAWSERALRNDPLNARAFLILGLLSQHDNDEKRTEVLMQAAVRRSLHESAAVYWMMQKSYQKQDYHAAIRYADTLLRTQSDVAHVMRLLGNIAENKDASGELKQVLAANPPWRPGFLHLLPLNVSDARTPLEFLLSLKQTSTPPTAADIKMYLDVLIDHKLYELAYYTWLQFLAPAQLSKIGRLFNGDFEVPTSGSPFDWSFTQGSGVTLKIAARPDKEGNHALYVNFGGERVDKFDVRQLIWLAPGNYRFQGKEKVDIASQRGLRWHVSCINQAATEIGGSSAITGHAPAWSGFEFSFTVPTGCPAQYVWLNFDARWASEQFISGSIWFDDLEVVREQVVNQ